MHKDYFLEFDLDSIQNIHKLPLLQEWLNRAKEMGGMGMGGMDGWCGSFPPHPPTYLLHPHQQPSQL